MEKVLGNMFLHNLKTQLETVGAGTVTSKPLGWDSRRTVAQAVERGSEEPGVEGSTPSRPAN